MSDPIAKNQMYGTTEKCGKNSCEEEPEETPVEHATEKVIGREIHREEREPPMSFGTPQYRDMNRFGIERPMPMRMMSARIPRMTNAGAMLRTGPTLPTMGTGFNTIPRMDFMRFDAPKMFPPRGGIGDPFRDMSGFGKRKKLPRGMDLFQKRGSRKRMF